ncbi:uncharacterized protein LOC143358066 isoform X2 [Halictus rubicundus]|uniref:uncharacterized protein LOC143358066 isoform X2 n=1 Tax=Halictus rubicundus TaxID=77578 RepID=UPI0040367002
MEIQQNAMLPLSGTGDLGQNWQEWRDNFIRYLTVNNYIKTSEDLKIRKLKEHIGPLGIYFIDIVSKECDENQLNNLQRLLAKLDIAFKVPPGEIEARYNFFTCSREKDEYIDKYIDRLKEKAKYCNFGNMMDNLIRDKVITDIKDKHLLSKLFKMKYLDLSMLCKICSEYEMVKILKEKAQKAQIAKRAELDEQFKKAKTAELAKKAEQVEKAKIAELAKKAEQVEKAKIAELGKKTEKVKKKNFNTEEAKIDNRTDGSDINKTASQKDQIQPVKFNRNCWKCDQRHQIRCCPAFGHKCEKCGDRNHFTHCCKMKIPNDAEKKNPSAPPAFEVDNTLYPNLSYLRSSERYT